MATSAYYGINAGWDSDIIRLWVVGQYVKQHTDPWRVSYETLLLNFGPARGEAAARLREHPIFEVHPHLHTEGIAGVIPEFGPPTSTYPPPGMLIFTILTAWAPQSWMLPGWLCVNIVLLAVWAAVLNRWRRGSEQEQEARCGPVRNIGGGDMLTLDGVTMALVLTLSWPPVHEILRTSQYGILMTLLIVLGFLLLDSHECLAGACFSLALFKPHIAIPYLVLPLIWGKWRALVTAALIQMAALLGIAWWLHTPPWTLMITWLHIAPYMFQGAYTMQEFIRAVNLGASPIATLLPLLLLTFTLGWCWRYRACPRYLSISFLSLVSVFWMYHERYDFVVLLLPIMASCVLEHEPAVDVRCKSLLLPGFAVLGVALTDYAYLHDQLLSHVMRWLGRLALYALIGAFALLVRRCAIAGKQRAAVSTS